MKVPPEQPVGARGMNRAQRRQAERDSRRATRQGHPRRADPVSYLRTINSHIPFTEAEKTALNLPVRLAFEAMRRGHAQDNDFDTLAVVANTCLIRAEQIGAPELMAHVIAAQDALMRIKARQQRTGRLGLDHQAMADLLPIIDLHEQLIDLSLPTQMQAALMEVMARMKRGQVHQIQHTQGEPA